MIVLGSRRSRLALVQTELVAALLRERAGAEVRLETMDSRGDKELGLPLPQIGGKGLFTAELEAALRSGAIDAAVHSLKDLPVEEAPEVTVGAVPAREATHDVLVMRREAHDARQPWGLRQGAVVGTSSPRRRAALHAVRPDLEMRDLRGNVPTRVDKVRQGTYDATVLAAAGLHRLGLDLSDVVEVPLDAAAFTPAPGQGALAVQCRRDDPRVREALSALHDAAAARAVEAERAVLSGLGGGCSMPLGVLAQPGRLIATLYAETERGAARYTVVLHGDDPGALAERAVERLRPLVGMPLSGKHVVVLGNEPVADAGSALEDGLAVAGAEVERLVAARTVALAPAVDAGTVDAIAVTSARAAVRLLDERARLPRPLEEHRLFAVGDASAAPLRAEGLAVEVPAAAGGGAALARFVAGHPAQPRRLLFACAEERHSGFEDGLEAAGIAVVPWVLYRVEPVEVKAAGPDAAAVIVTSPAAAPAARGWPGVPMVALGATTATALTALGLEPAAVAARPDAAGLTVALHEVSPCV